MRFEKEKSKVRYRCPLIASFLGSVFFGFALPVDGATLIPLDGEPVEGKVIGISDEAVQLEGSADPVPSAGILRLENGEVTGKAAAQSQTLYLVGGGRVPVDKIAFDSEAEVFEIEVAGAGAQKLSIDVVGALLLDPKADRTRFDEVRAEPTTEFDRILIDVGAEIQVLKGLLDGFGEGVVSVEVDGEMREFPIAKVTGIVLASVPAEKAESWVEVVAANGSVFTGGSVSLDDSGSLSINLGSGEPLKLPWTAVARVEFFSPQIAFLSDLKPKSTATAPIVALPREPRLGSNVLGGDLVINGRTFRRGLGMPGGSEITFKTKGYDRFRATVGIDDAASGRGNCEVVIKSGGQQIFKAQIKGGEPPKAVNVDLAGADEITLAVLPGADLDLADYADWGDAVLIRKEN